MVQLQLMYFCDLNTVLINKHNSVFHNGLLLNIQDEGAPCYFQTMFYIFF